MQKNKSSKIMRGFFSFERLTTKGLMKRLIIYCLGVISICSFVLLLMFAPRYIYTPPALDEQNVDGYFKIISFIESLNSTSGSISFSENVNGTFFTLDHIMFHNKESKLKKRIGENKYKEFMELVEFVSNHNISSVRYDENFIAFPKKHLIFESPGVIFSKNGKDPNKIEEGNRFFIYRPFEQISGNWYMSRRLHSRFGTRYGYKYPVPSSIFDYSLSVPEKILKHQPLIKLPKENDQ